MVYLFSLLVMKPFFFFIYGACTLVNRSKFPSNLYKISFSSVVIFMRLVGGSGHSLLMAVFVAYMVLLALLTLGG